MLPRCVAIVTASFAALLVPDRPAAARDPINMLVESEGATSRRGFTSITQIPNAFSDSALRARIPGYTSNSAADTLAGFPLHASAYVVTTHFVGSPVFVRHFQEMGVFVTPGADSRFGVGLQVMTGDRGLFGVTMSTGVRF